MELVGGGPASLLPTTPTDISNKSPPTNSILSLSQKPNLMSSLEDTPLKGQLSPAGDQRWEDIRELDDAENWSERTRVISKQDHQFYSKCAEEFVTDIVEKLPSSRNNEEFDYGISGANGISDHPPGVAAPRPPVSNDDFNYMNQFTDEDFQSSSAQFDVDYLERMSSTNNPGPSALARESLYVKFDPLVSSSVTAVTKRDALPSALPQGDDSLLLLNTPPSSHFNTPRATSSTISSEATPHTTSYNLLHFGQSPNLLNRPLAEQTQNLSPAARTLLDASPASIAAAAGNIGPRQLVQMPRSSLEGNTELVKVLKYSEADVQQIVIMVKQECQAELDRQLLLVREEYSEEVRKLQKKMDRLVKELQNLRSNSALQTTSNAKVEEEMSKLKTVCSEHLSTEQKLLEMYEKLKEESQQIEQQRDQALLDFNSIEKSFAEFHSRYSKARESVTILQKSEASLQQHIGELEDKIAKLEQLNQQLENDTNIKIDEANKIYEKLQAEHTSELAVTKANVKKMTVQISSLEGQLQQKEQEKQELTQICEDLMKELGSK